MKYLIALLSAIIWGTATYAQQYGNILQTPESIKLGSKGTIKKITCETYLMEMVMGKPIKKQLKHVDVDSFDKNGYILSTRNTTSNWTSVYQYDKNKQLTGRTYYNGNRTDYKATFQLLSQNTYVSSTYSYDKSKSIFSKEANSSDTLIFNSNNRLDTQHSMEGSDYYQYVNNDTTIVSILDGSVIFVQTVMERDAVGNKTLETSIPNKQTEYTEPYLFVYKYEYYQ